METGIEPPPPMPRERRQGSRAGDARDAAAMTSVQREGLLGATPDTSLPAPTLEHGMTDEELSAAGTRRSLLGRVGGWF